MDPEIGGRFDQKRTKNAGSTRALVFYLCREASTESRPRAHSTEVSLKATEHTRLKATS